MTTEQFHFTGADGKDYTLPKKVKTGVLRNARAASDLDFAFNVVEAVADPATLAAIDELDTAEFNSIVAAWLKGMRPGESSPSSN